MHNEPGSDYKCIRIPSIVVAGRLLVALAAGRRWYGDGCCPASAFPTPGVCVNSSSGSAAGLGADGELTAAAAAADSGSCRTDLVMKTSSDSGRSWSPLSVAVPCAGSCNALTTRSGELLLYHSNTTDNLLSRAKPANGKIVFGAAEVVRNGSATFRTPAGGPMRLSPGPGRAIQLSSTHPIAPGRILSEGYYPLPGCSSRMVCNQSAVQVYYSDDGGLTHTASRTQLPGVDESQLLELEDGSLRLYSRNRLSCFGRGKTTNARGMCMAVTSSTDAGATWFGTRANPALARSDCATSVLRHPSAPGGVLVTLPEYNGLDCTYSTMGRWNGTVRFSADSGASWPAAAGVRVTDFPPNPFAHEQGSFKTAHFGCKA